MTAPFPPPKAAQSAQILNVDNQERLGRKWTKHILPLEDGWSDPPGITFYIFHSMVDADLTGWQVSRYELLRGCMV